jgi:hypothetical protein
MAVVLHTDPWFIDPTQLQAKTAIPQNARYMPFFGMSGLHMMIKLLRAKPLNCTMYIRVLQPIPLVCTFYQFICPSTDQGSVKPNPGTGLPATAAPAQYHVVNPVTAAVNAVKAEMMQSATPCFAAAKAIYTQ